jgi:cytosine/adenosine deaminase-related metal-dependent hydrolase
MRTWPHRPRALLGAFTVLLGTAACGAEPDPAPTEPSPTAPVMSEAVTPSSYILRGTILTPAGALKGGYVGIIDGRIAAVSLKRPDIPGASIIGTDAIILPGFVDLHNHVPWNVLPRWDPPRFYANRYEWRDDPEHQRAVRQPFDDLVDGDHFCEMNAWGELRALVGGTTSIMATHGEHPCIHGLVRNLDYNSGFYGTTELDREHIIDFIGIPRDRAGRAQFVAGAQFYITNPAYEALSLHVAEGSDAISEEEFTFLQSQALLNPKGILIHGISLVPADFQAMAAAGTALVWSPQSNLQLYGTTADVGAALDAGAEVALAPDWAVTGSSNMLDELKVAAAWNRSHLGSRLGAREMVDMVTSVPAHVAGIDDEVGTLQAGLRADVIVLRGDAADPYGSVLRAEGRDVQLVIIDGVPLYGDATLMLKFWPGSELEPVAIARGTKMLATRAAGESPAALAAALRPLLEAEGSSLASLTEVDPPEPE